MAKEEKIYKDNSGVLNVSFGIAPKRNKQTLIYLIGDEGFVVHSGSPSQPHWNSIPTSKREVNDNFFKPKTTPGTVPPPTTGFRTETSYEMGIGIKAAIKRDSERIA